MTTSIEEKYKRLSEIEHVLARPGMYVGSTKSHTAWTWVVDEEKQQMVKKKLTWNPALLKLFDEVASNSVDEAKRKGSNLNTIKVIIDRGSGKITVEDNGGIPVVVHKDEDQYVPEMLFSELRAGSNFDDDNQDMVAGQNGLGASLVNVLSSEFVIKTADGKKQFSQKFTDNLHKRTEPKVTSSEKKFTSVSFIPDYERFDINLDEGNYAKLVKRVYDLAGCNPDIRVSLNGKRVKLSSFKDYVKLYTNDAIYEEQDDWRVALSASEDGFQHVSFVNGTETSIGGSHIEYVIGQIVAEIQEYIKKKYKMTVRSPDIKNHMALFVDCSVHNPRYSSQTKEELITETKEYGTEYIASKTFINKIIKSDIIHSVIEWVELKKEAAEKAALRKKQKDVNRKKVASHIPANSKDREKCTLFITEGLSAISNLLNVRDTEYHGGFPLRGKPKNVRGLKPTEIIKNEEISNLMSIIGLEYGEKAENLNYGNIVFMADSDFDGLSIVTLLINFFSIWPDLFEEGRIKILQTPIVIARKKKQVKRFYTMDEYVKADIDNSWDIEYNKGLGSLSIEEYEKAVVEPFYKDVELDDEYDMALELAFGKNADNRKKWLLDGV